MNYKCSCGGPLIPCRIGIEEGGFLTGAVCFKQWCPKCGNSLLIDNGEILYYTIKSDGDFTTDKMNFWVPETVPFQLKNKVIDIILGLAYEGRFKGKQDYSMKQIREVYRERYGSQGR